MKKPFIPKWMHHGTFHRRLIGPDDPKDLMGEVDSMSFNLSNMGAHLDNPVGRLRRTGPGWEVEVTRHGNMEFVKTTLSGGSYFLILFNPSTDYAEWWDLGKLEYNSPQSLPAKAAGETDMEDVDKLGFRLWAGWSYADSPAWEESWFYPFTSRTKFRPSEHMYFELTKMYLKGSAVSSYSEDPRRVTSLSTTGIEHETARDNNFVEESGGVPGTPTWWYKKTTAGSNTKTATTKETMYIDCYKTVAPDYERPVAKKEVTVWPERTSYETIHSATWDMEQTQGAIGNKYHSEWNQSYNSTQDVRNWVGAGSLNLMWTQVEGKLVEATGSKTNIESGDNWGTYTADHTFSGKSRLYYLNRLLHESDYLVETHTAEEVYPPAAPSGTYSVKKKEVSNYIDFCLGLGESEFIAGYTRSARWFRSTYAITSGYKPYGYNSFGFVPYYRPYYPTISTNEQNDYWISFCTPASLSGYADPENENFRDVDTEGFKRVAGVTSIRLHSASTGGGDEGYAGAASFLVVDDYLIATVCLYDWSSPSIEDIYTIVVNRASGKHAIIHTGDGGVWPQYFWDLGARIKGVGTDAKEIEV